MMPHEAIPIRFPNVLTDGIQICFVLVLYLIPPFVFIFHNFI